MYDNEEGQNLDKYEDEGKGEGIRYIPLPFVDLLSPPQKESKCPTDLDKRIRSLNHHKYILKIG